MGYSPSGGVPCVSAPLGGTIEPSAEVEIDAQKRGETERNRGIRHLELEGKLSKWTLTSVQAIAGKEKKKQSDKRGTES